MPMQYDDAFLSKIREVIIYYLEQQSHEYFGGSIDLNENCFDSLCKRKRGRAAGKVAVFVYTVFNSKPCPKN